MEVFVGGAMITSAVLGPTRWPMRARAEPSNYNGATFHFSSGFTIHALPQNSDASAGNSIHNDNSEIGKRHKTSQRTELS